KLHREIARLRATQDAIDIRRGTTKNIYRVWSIGKQTAVSGIERESINRRYVVSGRRQYDRRAMREQERILHHDKAAPRAAPKGDDGRFDISVAMNGRNI